EVLTVVLEGIAVERIKRRAVDYRTIDPVKGTVAQAADAEIRHAERRHHAALVPAFAVQHVKIAGTVLVDENGVKRSHRKRLAARRYRIQAKADGTVGLAQRGIIADSHFKDSIRLAWLRVAVGQYILAPELAPDHGRRRPKSYPFQEVSPRCRPHPSAVSVAVA